MLGKFGVWLCDGENNGDRDWLHMSQVLRLTTFIGSEIRQGL